MNNIVIILTIISLTVFCSCEKVIELVPENQAPKLVVDGSIENGQAPLIFLTNSLNFFNKLTPDFLMEVMELNELKMDGAEKEEITRKAQMMEDEIFEEIKNMMESYNDENATPSDLLKIKDYYYKKKYIDRLLAE